MLTRLHAEAEVIDRLLKASSRSRGATDRRSEAAEERDGL